MMAIQSADEERRSLRDADARATERVQDQINAIDLLEKRGEITSEAAKLAKLEARNVLEKTIEGKIKTQVAAAALVSPEEVYFKSGPGKFALSTYNTIQGNESYNDDEKQKRFVAAIGSQTAANKFFEMLGFDNAASGPVVQKKVFDEIPE
tara:strand:- start:253 stop:705 length:453 start_codon:yes stop_codon:yes gene_type:complete